MSRTILKVIQIELVEDDLDSFSDKDLIRVLKAREYDFADHARTDDLVDELEARDYDFSRNCHKDHFDEDPNKVNRAGNDEIMRRFQECHDLLTWEQWNHVFSEIEKESRGQRINRPKKYDRL